MDEDISALEKIILSKRDYVFKIPKEAVVLISGGLDSIVGSAILMSKFKMKLYPLFIRRGQRSLGHEESAIKFFTGFFKKKYPGLFQKPFVVDVNIPVSEIKHLFHKGIGEQKRDKKGYPMRNSSLESVGVQYAVSLMEEDEPIKTVFAFGTGDDVFPHSSLSSYRSQTINTCIHMDDWKWQITSPYRENILDGIKNKTETVKWGAREGMPLEKTFSCTEGKKIHCGVCQPCQARKNAFSDARVADKTVYEVFR